MKRIILSIIAATSLASQAAAFDYVDAAAPHVADKVDELIFTLGLGCDVGNTVACDAIPAAQFGAQVLLTNAYRCSQGHGRACADYMRNLEDLDTAFDQVEALHVSGDLYTDTGGGALTGAGHTARMQVVRTGVAIDPVALTQPMPALELEPQTVLSLLIE